MEFLGIPVSLPVNNDFSAHMDVGGPSHGSLMRSIEIFGTRIAPKVREALKK